jgi:hypothetical protein
VVATLSPARLALNAQHDELADQSADRSIAGHASTLGYGGRLWRRSMRNILPGKERTKAAPVESPDGEAPDPLTLHVWGALLSSDRRGLPHVRMLASGGSGTRGQVD